MTDRERQVLRRVTFGWQDKRIAASLDISVATVRSHVRGILRGGRFGNRWEAAAWALQHRPAVFDPDQLIPLDGYQDKAA